MMPTCKMNETKLEVSENYEEAELELSDVDDDVFVRSGGRNGFRLELYDSAKKPLMTPRRKTVRLQILSIYCIPYDMIFKLIIAVSAVHVNVIM